MPTAENLSSNNLSSKVSNALIWVSVFLLFLSPHLSTVQLVDNFTIIKWSTVYLASFTATLALAFQPRTTIFSGKLFWIAGALIAARVLSILINFNWVSVTNGLDSLIFILLVISFITFIKNKMISFEKIFWLFSVSSAILIGRAVFDLIRYRLMDGRWDPLYFSVTFGNINMISEYLTFLLPLLIYYIRNFNNWKSHVSGVIYSLFLMILLTGQSRSAMIAVGLFAAFSLYRNLNRKELLYGLLGVGLFLVTLGFPTVGADYSLIKEGSFHKRSHLYVGSLQMLADSPLGVGGGLYEYGYIPYQLATGEKPTEVEIYRTPHDEFLKWGIESGWLFLLAQLIWWHYLLYLCWKVKNSKESKEIRFFSVSFLLILAPQVLFQFPFDNAVSFYLIAFILAFILAQFETKDFQLKVPTKIGYGLVAILLLTNATAYTYSHYVDSMEATILASTQRACEVYPANWRACNSQGVVQVLSDFSNDAMPVLRDELHRRPFQFVALRLLALAHIKGGNPQLGCQIGRVYDSLFDFKSMWTKYLDQNCPGIPSPLKFENGPQFKRDYINWLMPLIKN